MTSQQPSEVGMPPVLLYRRGSRGSKGSSALLKVTQPGEGGLEAMAVIPGARAFCSSNPGLGFLGQEQSLSQGIREAPRQGRQTYSHGRLCTSPSRPSAPGVCEQPAPHWDRQRGPASGPTLALSKEMTVGGASSRWLLSLLSFFFCMSNKY